MAALDRAKLRRPAHLAESASVADQMPTRPPEGPTLMGEIRPHACPRCGGLPIGSSEDRTCANCGYEPITEFERAQTSKYLEQQERKRMSHSRAPRHGGTRKGQEWAS